MRAALTTHRHTQLLSCVRKSLHRSRPLRLLVDEVTVGILLQIFLPAMYLEDLLHARIIRSDIRQADRPVIAKAITRLCLELIVTQPERLPGPEERSSPKQPHPHPVIGVRLVKGVRHLLLVHPHICIELVRLKDVCQFSRWFEASMGKLVRWFSLRITTHIHNWSSV